MANNSQAQPLEPNSIIRLVLDLYEPDRRENAMKLLAQSFLRRDMHRDLAPLLWNTPGIVAALIQEIIAIYPVLSPPTLSGAQSNRVVYTMALFQCLASHPNTRMLFLKVHIPLYLYPFLNATSTSSPFENLRLSTLGVIGALVKVATFIVQQILLDDVGLNYICTTSERFYAVERVLGNMVAALAEQRSSRPLEYIIRCYLRLSANPRACYALRSCLPVMLRDGTFNSCIREDQTTQRCLQILLHNVPAMQPRGGFHRFSR